MDEPKTCPCVTVKVSQVNGSIVAHAECSRDYCGEWQDMVAERDALRAEVERLRAVMAWYANEDNWEPIIEHRRGSIGYGPSNVATYYDVERPSAAAADYGDRARAALGVEGE